MTGKDSIEQAIQHLWKSIESNTPCSPIRNIIGDQDIEAAYEVQNGITDIRLDNGARIVGAKIGLTSEAVQKQFGISQPDYGLLFDDMPIEDGGEISVKKLMQPKAEAEIAFILRNEIDGENVTRAEIIDAIQSVVPAIEIVGSRIENWDISITDTIADNASASHYVLGSTWINADDLNQVDVEVCKMVLYKNGKKESDGIGSACMGSPLNAMEWLARKMIEVGSPLQEGDVILSGALGPMVPISMGDVLETRIEGLGSVSITITN